MLRRPSRDGRFGGGQALSEDHPEESLELESAPPAPALPAVVTRSAPLAAVAPHASASIIDATATFDGRYEAAQDLIIMGTVSGEILCKGVLTIEQNASAKAKIAAHEANIRGRVDGDIVCSGRLLIASSAHITGTIKAGALVVEDGATIKGSVETASGVSAELEPSLARSPRKPAPERAESESAAAAAPGSARWTRSRDVPTFALVSSDERAGIERESRP